MSEDLVVLTCEKCGAKLKVKPAAVKALKEIKCVKCGAKVPTRKESPVTTDSVPIPLSTTPASPIPTSASVASASSAAPAALEAAAAAAAAIAQLPTAAPPVTPESIRAQARIKELEDRVANLLEQGAQLTLAKSRIAELEQALAQASKPNYEVARLKREMDEQADRVTELQQLWMQKEKETREAQELVARANRERLAAIADRERAMAAVKDILTSYHLAEIENSRQRLTDLEQKIQQYVNSARGA